MRRPRIYAAAGAAVLALGATVLLTRSSDEGLRVAVPNNGTEALVKTQNGVRWQLKGQSLAVTFTSRTPRRVLLATQGKRVLLACAQESSDPAYLVTTVKATARVPKSAGGVAVRFSSPIPQVTGCVIEPAGEPDDIATVRFGDEPPRDERAITVVK